MRLLHNALSHEYGGRVGALLKWELCVRQSAPPFPAGGVAVNLAGEALGRAPPMAQLVSTLRGTALNATEAALEARGSAAVPSAVVVNVWGPLVLFSLHTAACVRLKKLALHVAIMLHDYTRILRAASPERRAYDA